MRKAIARKSAPMARLRRPTVQQLAVEVAHLRERVEDLEDLRDLREAIQRNKNKPLIAWEEVKRDLELQ